MIDYIECYNFEVYSDNVIVGYVRTEADMRQFKSIYQSPFSPAIFSLACPLK
jgi:hypothetical protein